VSAVEAEGDAAGGGVADELAAHRWARGGVLSEVILAGRRAGCAAGPGLVERARSTRSGGVAEEAGVREGAGDEPTGRSWGLDQGARVGPGGSSPPRRWCERDSLDGRSRPPASPSLLSAPYAPLLSRSSTCCSPCVLSRPKFTINAAPNAFAAPPSSSSPRVDVTLTPARPRPTDLPSVAQRTPYSAGHGSTSSCPASFTR